MSFNAQAILFSVQRDRGLNVFEEERKLNTYSEAPYPRQV